MLIYTTLYDLTTSDFTVETLAFYALHAISSSMSPAYTQPTTKMVPYVSLLSQAPHVWNLPKVPTYLANIPISQPSTRLGLGTRRIRGHSVDHHYCLRRRRYLYRSCARVFNVYMQPPDPRRVHLDFCSQRMEVVGRQHSPGVPCKSKASRPTAAARVRNRALYDFIPTATGCFIPAARGGCIPTVIGRFIHTERGAFIFICTDSGQFIYAYGGVFIRTDSGGLGLSPTWRGTGPTL